ncbi:MAG: inverse autotransporter beta domain-containing protein, partial [Legionellales bacterium]|nr:inverse autotransporter beta domain-containing protein [Legionellales bacterium]
MRIIFNKGLLKFFLNNNNKIDIFKMVLILVPMYVCADSENRKYSPRIQTEGKIGNRRSIVRPAALIPLYQQSNSLIHLSLIGMSDTKSALEGNIGLGARHIVKDNIFGVYGFYDIRRSSQSNMIHQLTLGGEWFKKYFEFRFNIYLPQKKTFQISEVKNQSYYRKSGSTIDIELRSSTKVEQALPGFDIDIGAQLPSLPELTVRGAYYRFTSSDNHIESRNGFRGVLGYQLFEFLSLDFEMSYDNQRKLVYFGGLTLGYNFDGLSRNQSRLTRLERKMNILPIRDIDAVLGGGHDEHDLDSISISGIDEQTTILIADSGQNELVMLDVVDGSLVVRKSSYNSENLEITQLIQSYHDKDIITDNRVLTFMVDGDDILDVNEFHINVSGLVINHSKEHSIGKIHKDAMVNLINLISVSAENLRRSDFYSKKYKNLLKQYQETESELNRLKRELEQSKQQASQKQQDLNSRMQQLREQSELEKQRLLNSSNQKERRLQEQLDNLNQHANQRQSELTDELNRLEQESLHRIRELEQRINDEQRLANEQLVEMTEKFNNAKDKTIEVRQRLEEELRNATQNATLKNNLLQKELVQQKELARIQQEQLENELQKLEISKNEAQRRLEEELRNTKQSSLKQQQILQKQQLLLQEKLKQQTQLAEQQRIHYESELKKLEMEASLAEQNIKKQLSNTQQSSLEKQRILQEQQVQLQKKLVLQSKLNETQRLHYESELKKLELEA